MKSALKKWMTIPAAAVACVGLASVAGATTLTYGDANFIGVVVSGEPASLSNEAVYVNTLIDQAAGTSTAISGHTYDRTDSTFDCSGCPDAVGDSTAFQSLASPATTIDVSDGWTYLIAKYDGPQGGDLIWNIVGLTSVTIPGKWGPATTQYGLSHYALFNPTEGPGDGPGDGPGEGPAPEPTSLLLFGSALSAFGFRMRRALR
ncbi:MAG TPA: PEP-CTERM sorting domain-containing protein [Thermomicrobiales bacterium]|nr:PEP-CTERM sorting domain-containing protein [Thermomicrobiales bacterium]